jgi:uncharacterized membrane protein
MMPFFAEIPQKKDNESIHLPIFKIFYMEKRLLGIILSILGIIGLILSGVYFVNSGHGEKNTKEIILFGLLGAIFFFAGISLVRNTKDKAT